MTQPGTLYEKYLARAEQAFAKRDRRRLAWQLERVLAQGAAATPAHVGGLQRPHFRGVCVDCRAASERAEGRR